MKERRRNPPPSWNRILTGDLIMGIIMAIAVILMLTSVVGCVATMEAVGDAATESSETAAATAIVYICDKARIGVVLKRFAVSESTWDAYLRLCGRVGAAPRRPEP